MTDQAVIWPERVRTGIVLQDSPGDKCNGRFFINPEMTEDAVARSVSACLALGFLGRALSLAPLTSSSRGVCLTGPASLGPHGRLGRRSSASWTGCPELSGTSIMMDTQEALRSFARLGIKHSLSSYYVLGPEVCRAVG